MCYSYKSFLAFNIIADPHLVFVMEQILLYLFQNSRLGVRSSRQNTITSIEVSINGDAIVGVSGNSVTVSTTTPLVWSLVDDSQTASWSGVSTSQTPNWTAIDDSQTPNWKKVA